jgi:hypothetical protein
MANQNYRDVNTVVLGGTAIRGVEVARLMDEGEVLEFFSDAIPHRQDVGLTKQIAMVEIQRISDQKYRDVLSAVFTSQQGGTTGAVVLGRVQAVDIRVSGSELRDSGDADAWIRSLGLSRIVGQGSVTYRDLGQPRTSLLVKGKKGTLTVKVPVPRTGFGLPAQTATETHKFTCMLAEMSQDSEHAALGEARASFEFYGIVDPWSVSGGVTGGKQLKPVALGWKGTVAYNAPAGDAASSESVSVANALLVGHELAIRHGEYARSTLRFAAHSSNGQASPIT